VRKIKLLLAAIAASALFGAAATGASADIVRNGSVFTATPSYCSCWSTQDGYQFVGIPYSPYIVNWLGLPADTPVVVNGENTGIADLLRADPNYQPLPPVTSGSVTVDVGGTVEDTSGDDPPAEEAQETRSSWGRKYGRLSAK
jgi:hypothetical protein